MTEESTDRRLRDAGRRLRDTAPSAAATETALDLLDARRATPSRARWIAPLAFVAAAAAAVVGVLVLTRPDESGRVVPADTTTVPATSTAPATSAAPVTSTAPTTTATTTTATPTTIPVTGPAFVGDLPLDASAAIVGCPGEFGDLADAVDPATWPIRAVGCAGDDATLTTGGDIALHWNGAGWDPGDVVVPTRPLPPAWIVEDPNYLPGVDAAGTLAGLDVTAGDAAAFATALGEALQAITSGDPVPRVETAVLDDAPVVTVMLNGIPDDSSSRLVYVVRYADQDGTLTPHDGLAFTYCNRGVTTDGLCV